MLQLSPLRITTWNQVVTTSCCDSRRLHAGRSTWHPAEQVQRQLAETPSVVIGTRSIA